MENQRFFLGFMRKYTFLWKTRGFPKVLENTLFYGKPEVFLRFGKYTVFNGKP